MRKIFTVIMCLIATVAMGNDGVFFVNGNELTPIHETDISIAKEVLTISIGDDGYATVDVQYEMMNHGKAKIVQVGFEACAPYNDTAKLDPSGRHPYISDFTVSMNGKVLTYKNAVVASIYEQPTDFKPIDLKRWKTTDGMDFSGSHNLYDASTDSIIGFSYAYCFEAPFREGMNTIHHTYRYRLSYGVWRTFEVPYWLKPAMRWQNKQIDDFTLRIKAENTAKHFCFNDSLFTSAPFKIEGTGKMRKVKQRYDGELLEVALRNATLVWHSKNFIPRDNITIYAADMLYGDRDKLGAFYDRSKRYVLWGFMNKKPNKKILRNLPYANRGYVFKNKKLQRYFSSLWWYMPDPQWQASTADFTPREWQMINEGK